MSSFGIDSGYNLLNNVCVAAAGSVGSSEVATVVGLSEAVCESGASESGLRVIEGSSEVAGWEEF
jgi:hypothetical protein